MAVIFPPLLQLRDERAFADYQAEFDRLYRSGEVKDVLGRVVLFDNDSCRRACTSHNHTVWAQARAERLRWITTALRTPKSVRPSHQMPNRQVYMVEGNLELPTGKEWHRFLVYVEPEGKPRAKTVRFVTAFPPDTLKYWKDAELEPGRIYPRRSRP
jgi:hypothetical protein